jgi:hypothetical protein
MPTTSLGIRYPTMKEVIDAADFQATADDIDALLLALATKRSLVRNRLGAHITGASNSVAVATDVDLVFNTEVWDVGGISNLGVNNQIMTLTSGIWFVAGVALAASWTTVDAARVGVTLNGALHTAHQLSRNTQTLAYIRTAGVIVSGADGDQIGLRAHWNGTGGPAGFSPRLTALRIRPL